MAVNCSYFKGRLPSESLYYVVLSTNKVGGGYERIIYYEYERRIPCIS